MDHTTRRKLLFHHWVFVVLLIAAAALLAALTRMHHTSWDLTLNGRNTLSPGSLDVLGKLKAPIYITAYAAPDSAAGRALAEFLAPYRRAKADIKLTHIDPDEQPQLARQAGIQREGELVVSYAGRSEHLMSYNESALTNLLMRLARDQERLVLYLEGHGERSLAGEANHDLGEFGRQLGLRGVKTGPLRLPAVAEVPRNAAFLLITHPQVSLLPGEIEKLRAYLAGGGNLLWLLDAEPLRGLEALAEDLELVLTPGTVVDPQAQRFNASASMAVSAAYAQHALFQNFGLMTVFPFAREVEAAEDSQVWRVTPLIQVAPQGWIERGRLDGTVRFDEGQDKRGPVTIAVALERQVENSAQRVVVIGNGAFLSNQFIGNAGNLDFGINLVNWLAGDDQLITIQPRTTQDTQMALGQGARLAIVLGFLFVLPLALLLSGGAIWWRRRRP